MSLKAKIKAISAFLAVCTFFTACGNAVQTEVENVQITEQTTTTVVSDIYAAPVETVTWADEEVTSGTAEEPATVMVSDFSKASDFNEGHAVINYNSMNYVVDTQGNIVSEFAERPKEYKIHDGGLIILENGNVINLSGEVIADKEVYNYDDLVGIWHGYIVLMRTVETLEKTYSEICILNNDGTVKLDWTPQENGNEEVNSVKLKANNFIQVGYLYTLVGYKGKGIYNLETGEYHYNHKLIDGKWVLKDEMSKYGADELNIEYYDYGYAVITEKGQYDHIDVNANIYDFDGKLLDKYTGISTGMRYSAGKAFNDGDIVWASYFSGYSNSFYDLRLRKIVTMPFDMEYIDDVSMERCGENEEFYNLELRNKEGTVFYAIADDNGNYLVEPTTLNGDMDCIFTYNDGVYVTNYKKMCKADGTVICEGGSFGQFTDGYCCMNGSCYIDINGNKLEVELPV